MLRRAAGAWTADALERVCRSALVDLMGRMRGPATTVPRAIPSDMSLREDGLGLDSLELLEAVADANRRFGLHVTGMEDHLLIFPTLGAWGEAVARHYAHLQGAGRMVFATSGTTDAPRQVEHACTSLDREVNALLAELGGDGDAQETTAARRVVSLVPCHHIFGFLFTALLPARAGWPLLDLCGGAPASALARCGTGDLLVATPFLLEMALRSDLRLPEEVEVVVSGAPLEQDLWTKAARRGLRILDVCGATETGGLGLRRSGTEPFTLLPHLERAGQGIRTTATVTDLDVQDRLDWVDGRRFHLRGRRDHVVQVGGVNVSPAAVARALRASDEVCDARVRLDAQSGRLKAFIVPKAPMVETAGLAADLRARMSAAFPPPSRPQRYDFGATLPSTPAGKEADW